MSPAQKKFTTLQLGRAFRLLERKEGATTRELSPVLGVASYDCPERIRYWLERLFPQLELVSERLPDKNERVYRVKRKQQRGTG